MIGFFESARLLLEALKPFIPVLVDYLVYGKAIWDIAFKFLKKIAIFNFWICKIKANFLNSVIIVEYNYENKLRVRIKRFDVNDGLISISGKMRIVNSKDEKVYLKDFILSQKANAKEIIWDIPLNSDLTNWKDIKIFIQWEIDKNAIERRFKREKKYSAQESYVNFVEEAKIEKTKENIAQTDIIKVVTLITKQNELLNKMVGELLDNQLAPIQKMKEQLDKDLEPLRKGLEDIQKKIKEANN